MFWLPENWWTEETALLATDLFYDAGLIGKRVGQMAIVVWSEQLGPDDNGGVSLAPLAAW